MNIELKLHHVNSDELVLSYIERRLSFVLSRFGERVGRVTVKIESLADGRPDELVCRMTADLHPFGVIMAEAADSDAFSAIDRCAGRLAKRCERKCTRARSVRPSRYTVRIPRAA